MKLGLIVVSAESWMNPDSSSGLHITAELRAKAHQVGENKEKQKLEEEKGKQETATKGALKEEGFF